MVVYFNTSMYPMVEAAYELDHSKLNTLANFNVILCYEHKLFTAEREVQLKATTRWGTPTICYLTNMYLT